MIGALPKYHNFNVHENAFQRAANDGSCMGRMNGFRNLHDHGALDLFGMKMTMGLLTISFSDAGRDGCISFIALEKFLFKDAFYGLASLLASACKSVTSEDRDLSAPIVK